MEAHETGWFRGEGGAIWQMDLPLPSGIQQRVVKGHVLRVNEDGSLYGDSAPERPADGASRAEWVGYASRVLGLDPEVAEGLTHQDLVDKATEHEVNREAAAEEAPHEVEEEQGSKVTEASGQGDASQEPAAIEGDTEVSQGPSEPAPKRPGKADDKATWVTYIAQTTDLSEAEAADLTKAELVALADDE